MTKSMLDIKNKIKTRIFIALLFVVAAISVGMVLAHGEVAKKDGVATASIAKVDGISIFNISNMDSCGDACDATTGEECGEEVCINPGAVQCDSSCDGTSYKDDGTDTGTCRQCDGAGSEEAPADDADCGTIDCDGNNYYYTSGEASATDTNYCKLRDYSDITTNRCEGLGDCKDANSEDCTSYADSTVATCDTCKYATGACSSCSNYDDGTDTGTCRQCDGAGSEEAPADDADCGTIDCDGLNYYYTSGTASVTETNYCKLRDYADITSSRCEGLGDCKDANTADCTSYADSTAATCGVCKYATGACTTCTNYADGTDSGTCRQCDGAGSEEAPADDSACGTIDCDGLNYYYTSGTASVTGTNYCKYRNYADITTNRCEGLGDCKDANTADCTSYADSTAATCGVCKYATGACSSCSNYANRTYCEGTSFCDGSGNCVAETCNLSSGTYCAAENGFCSFSGTRYVIYGANGSYSCGVFTDGVNCTNAIFGDPIYGYVKSCYYR